MGFATATPMDPEMPPARHFIHTGTLYLSYSLKNSIEMLNFNGSYNDNIIVEFNAIQDCDACTHLSNPFVPKPSYFEIKYKP